MGHILTAPLPRVASLTEASEIAASMRAADVVPPFASIFFETEFGLIGVTPNGTIRQAEVVGRPDGSSWVVLAA